MNKVSAKPKPGFLFIAASALSICTFLLVIAGGLVTSHNAGLAVPDWPTSYGQWFPPMVGNIFWEHGHRMIAGFVGIFTLVVASAVNLFESRTWIKKLSLWMLFAVLAQAGLGGLTVILMLPPPVSIFHACLAQTFFCLTIALAYFLSPGFFSRHPENQEFSPKLFRLARLTTIFIFVQLILGATVRHTGKGVIVHILGGFVVFIHVLLLLIKGSRESKNRFVTAVLIGLGVVTIVQIGLGMGSFIFTRMLAQTYAPSLAAVIFTASHQSLGALILGSSVWITLRVKQPALSV